ncbi:hypothetical protein ACFW6Q_06890, partial [Streptomyces sp. NPDC058737]|uniref:hypothetical protein n=1 Tax=Streptomyces sp. NPDC058737 TaxID=3346617 RepID=UPI0036BBFF53
MAAPGVVRGGSLTPAPVAVRRERLGFWAGRFAVARPVGPPGVPRRSEPGSVAAPGVVRGGSLTPAPVAVRRE